MKTKLLRKIRDINVIYQRNNEYKYVNYIKTSGGFWNIDTEWITDKQLLIDRRREKILEQARSEYKPPKKTI